MNERFVPSRSSRDEVEDGADDEDPGGDDGGEDRQERWLDDPTEHHERGDRQCHHAHHERHHGAQGGTLCVLRLGERDHAGGVCVQRHPQGGRSEDRRRVVAPEGVTEESKGPRHVLRAAWQPFIDAVLAGAG